MTELFDAFLRLTRSASPTVVTMPVPDMQLASPLRPPPAVSRTGQAFPCRCRCDLLASYGPQWPPAGLTRSVQRQKSPAPATSRCYSSSYMVTDKGRRRSRLLEGLSVLMTDPSMAALVHRSAQHGKSASVISVRLMSLRVLEVHSGSVRRSGPGRPHHYSAKSEI